MEPYVQNAVAVANFAAEYKCSLFSKACINNSLSYLDIVLLNHSTPAASHLAPLPRRSKNSGFSLVEVAIGAVVLLLIILPAVSVVVSSLRIIDKARDVTLASSLTQSLVEQMRMQTFKGLCTKYCGTSTLTSGTVYTYTKAQFSTDLNAEGFSTPQIANFDVSGSFTAQSAGQLYVEIKVSWKDLDSRQQTHTLFSVFSDGGLSDNVNKGW